MGVEERGVEVFRAEDGRWAWVYREHGIAFASNSSYESARQAAEAATGAYPGVPLRAPPEDAEPRRGLEGLSFPARILLALWALLSSRRRKRGRS